MISVECVRTLDALRAEAPHWDALLQRCPHRELYLTYSWTERWCTYFGGSGLRILLVKDDDQLVGIAPLMLTRERARGLSIRKLGFLLNGCSVRSDFIIPREWSRECFSALVRYFRRTCGEWDVISLKGVAERSGTPVALQQAVAAERGLLLAPPVTWDNLVLGVDGDWERYIKGRSYNFRRRLRSAERQLSTMGKVVVTRHDDPADVDAVMAAIFDIERRSWKMQGGEPVAGRSDYRAFYLDVTRWCAAHGAWRAWILSVDGVPVASLNTLSYEGTVYGEKMSYDASYATGSPGRVLFRAMVEDLFRDEAVDELDLDRETPFLGRWTQSTRRYHQATIFSRRPYSLFLWTLRQYGRPAMERSRSLLRKAFQVLAP